MTITKSKIFLICCLSFILGIGLASFLSDKLINYNFYIFIFAVILLITAVMLWKNDKVRLASLFGMFLFFGVWRFIIGLPADTPDKIWHYNNEKIKFIGVISAPPDVRKDNQKLTVETRFIASRNQGATLVETNGRLSLRDVTGKVLITAALYPAYNYGDELEIECQLQKPKEINGFAYDKYLARYGIYSLCYQPIITALSGGRGNIIFARVFEIKNKMVGMINRGLNEPSAGLANAIMFGDKRGLPEPLLNIFSQTGTTHIMAISGMNITILAALVLQFMLMVGLSRQQSFYLAVIILIIFIIMVGAPASAMRAGLMGFLVLWALKLGRLNKITNSVVLAGAIMLAVNPALLRYDIGFQLSFLAILGLVYFYPLIEERLDRIKAPKLKGGRQILSMTLAAQVFTLPITAANFGIISIVAPLPNLLILWTIPILTMIVFIALFLSFLLPALAFIFFTPAWLILKYIIAVSIWSAKLPLAFFKIDYINPVLIIIYYFVFIAMLFKISQRMKIKNRI